MAVRREVQPGGSNPYSGSGSSGSGGGSGNAELTARANQQRNGNGTLYYGIDPGSDAENEAINLPWWAKPDKYGHTPGGMAGKGKRRGVPKYKVGYLNSKTFRQDDLHGNDPNIILAYQQYMEAAGLITKYNPGQLDKPTRAAFKELLTRANQTGGTWQSALGDAVTTGQTDASGADGAGSTRAPFQAVLEDPASLRETFQKAAQSIYGGDLPDTEVADMVNAFQSSQVAKQQAAYNANGLGGTIQNPEMDPEAYAAETIKAKHPDQAAKVEFSGSLSALFAEGAKTGGGMM